jgi:CelD/BcsL family acetyltransferase involved in cellulose biosynthesis
MLHSLLITDTARLRALVPEWQELLGRSELNEVTIHPHWVLPWWEVFGPRDGRALRVLAFRAGDRLVGLAPLLARRHVYRPRIPFRRLELLASGEDEFDETCSDYLGIVAERGFEGEVARALADALSNGVAGGWDELSLRSMQGSSVLPSLLSENLLSRRYTVKLEEQNVCPHVVLPKTWDAYLGLLKRKKRWQVRDALKAYTEWSGGPPELVRVRSEAELVEGKRILRSLHRERWSAGGVTTEEGVYRSPLFSAFHDRVMPELLAMDALDLGWLSARGKPVAAFYNLRYDGRVFHYQSGRTLDVPENVRVGIVMNAALIRSAIEDGMREYDFLAGEAVYKSALAPMTRPLVTLRAARPSVVELARRATESALAGGRFLRERALQARVRAKANEKEEQPS